MNRGRLPSLGAGGPIRPASAKRAHRMANSAMGTAHRAPPRPLRRRLGRRPGRRAAPGPVFPVERPGERSRPWSRVTGRWSWPPPPRFVLRNEHDVSRTPSRPPSSSWPGRPDRSEVGRCWAAGCTAWAHAPASRPASRRGGGGGRRPRRRWARRDIPPDRNPNSRPCSTRIPRLPALVRSGLAVVLCDLEGLSYDQAARQLRWTVPRLRQGIACPTAARSSRAGPGPTGAPPPAYSCGPRLSGLAAVSPALARAAIAAATGRIAPGRASLLARHIWLRGMLATKLKIAGDRRAGSPGPRLGWRVHLRRSTRRRPQARHRGQGRSGLEAGAGGRGPAGRLAEVRGHRRRPGRQASRRARGSGHRRESRSTRPQPGPDGEPRLRGPPARPVGVRCRLHGGYPRASVPGPPGFGLRWIKNALEPGPSGESRRSGWSRMACRSRGRSSNIEGIPAAAPGSWSRSLGSSTG